MQLASFVIRFMTCQKFLFCRNDGNFISHFNLPRKFESQILRWNLVINDDHAHFISMSFLTPAKVPFRAIGEISEENRRPQKRPLWGDVWPFSHKRPSPEVCAVVGWFYYIFGWDLATSTIALGIFFLLNNLLYRKEILVNPGGDLSKNSRSVPTRGCCDSPEWNWRQTSSCFELHHPHTI